jgi:hypothetical protein
MAFSVASVLAAPASREEILASMYPGATIRSEQVFLTPAEQKRAQELARTDISSAFVVRYIASRDGHVVGRAYVDTHIVRTKKESLLVMLDANGQVGRIEATAFLEPAEYQAPEPWLRQYKDRRLDDDLALGRAIRPIAGATLTARAATNATRRVLAIDRVLMESADKGSR